MSTFIEQFRAARRVSTPLIGVRTPDPAATIACIAKAANGTTQPPPMLLWDIARGLVNVNEPGRAVVNNIMGGEDSAMLTNPVEMLAGKAPKLPPKTILFFLNVQRYLNEPSVIQAIWNLRDTFKQDTRTLVMLCPSISLPPELVQDVVLFDEPLPDTDQLRAIIAETYAAAKLVLPKEEVFSRAIDALCGLASFAAEQVSAMCITKIGLDLDALWERKRQQIEQAPGLSVWRGGERFCDLGGCENIKAFLRRVLDGESRPRAIVFIDEIEKALAGAGGDLSGTTQEMLGTLLTFMQDKNASGLLFIGPPGAAKSAMAKATGNEGGVPTVSFDVSGMKGSLVGQSGENMRAALKMVDAVAQGRALFIATCNSIAVLPPELRRRFAFGTFFFDLPTAAEREAIWKIYLTKFNTTNPKQKRPDDTDWTGAEIKQCCDLAWRLNCSLLEASSYIVPVAKSASEQIETLRRQAGGRFISASAPGVYQHKTTPAPTSTRRAIQ